MFSSTFLSMFLPDVRQAEAAKIREKHPDRIPVSFSSIRLLRMLLGEELFGVAM